jgi:hypothetical protein
VPAVVFATALLLAALPVRVESDACPSGAEVEQDLVSMVSTVSTVSGVTGQDVAKVERSDGKLRVVLIDDKAAVLAERVLDGHGSCAELAELAAIVIASWESDVHPEFVRPHAEPPAARPTVAPVPGGAYDLSLGASLSQAGQLAAGGSLGAAWFPRDRGLGLSFLLAVETTRTLDLGVGQARWRRGTGSPEIAWRWARRGLAVDGHGGARRGLACDERCELLRKQIQRQFFAGSDRGHPVVLVVFESPRRMDGCSRPLLYAQRPGARRTHRR